MEKLKFDVSLELREEDLKGILFKVAKDGIDLSTLLTGFVEDLVASNHNREDMVAVDGINAYYNRRWRGMNNKDTFLHYLIENCKIEDYIGILDDIEANKAWIANGGNREKALKESEKVLNVYYEEWLKNYKNEKVPQDKEKAFKSISEWYEQYEKLTLVNCEIVNRE